MNIFNTNIKNSNDIKCHTLEVEESVILPMGSINGSSIEDNSITGAKVADNSITGAKVADNSITGAKLNPQLLNNQLQALHDLASYEKIMKLNPVSGNIVDTLTENQVVATKKFNSLLVEGVNSQLTFTSTNNSSINMNSVNDDTINFKSAFQIKHSSANATDLEFRNIASDNTFFKYNLSTNTFGMGINAATNMPYTILNLDANGRTIKLPNCNNAQQTVLINNLSNGDKGCMTFNTETNRLLFWDGTTFHQIGGSIGLGDHSYLDTEFILAHVNDPTKKIDFNLNAITTGTTRTISIPDRNIDLDDFVTKDLDETITGKKTFTGNNLTIENNRLIKLRNDFSDSFHSISYQPAGTLEAVCLAGSDSSVQTSISAGYFTGNNSSNSWNDKFSARFSNNNEPKLFLNNQEIFTDYQTLHSNVINSGIRNLGIQNSNLDMGNNSISNITQLNSTSNTVLSYLNNVTSDIQSQLNNKIEAASTNTLTNKTISGLNNTITNISDSSLLTGINANKIHSGDVTNDEFNTLSGVTSNIQSQLNNKIEAASINTLTNKTISGLNNTITNIQEASLPSNINAAKISTGSVSNTEFDYLDGVTSSIQSQLNNKIEAASTNTLTNKTIDFNANTLTNVLSTNTEQNITATKTISEASLRINTSSATTQHNLLRIENTNSNDIVGLQLSNTLGTRGLFLNSSTNNPLTIYTTGLTQTHDFFNDSIDIKNVNGFYSINGTNILTGTTLGSTVVNSSLTSLGTLSSLTMGGNINMSTNNLTNVGSINGLTVNNLLTTDSTSTVSNKTISATNNTISEIGSSNLTAALEGTINNKWTKSTTLNGLSTIETQSNSLVIDDFAFTKMMEIRAGYTDIPTEYRVNGTKVVGSQQSHIPNTTLGNEAATINIILTALRNHGLIASS